MDVDFRANFNGHVIPRCDVVSGADAPVQLRVYAELVRSTRTDALEDQKDLVVGSPCIGELGVCPIAVRVDSRGDCEGVEPYGEQDASGCEGES
jgi:hypothetical protein